MKRYSASEIMEMKLPGVPRTKVGIRQMAEREGWPFTTTTGVGGTRRLYEVPTRLLSGQSQEGRADAEPVVTIAAGGRADPKVLAWTVKALEEWLDANGMEIDAERKGALISVLYDYVTRGAGVEEVSTLLRAMK